MTASAPSAFPSIAANPSDSSSPWGSPSQRIAQRRNKRDALFATAARLFRQQGFASTSLDQMAVQLGITKPTLYYYVRSKAELVHACAMLGFERAQASVQQALGAGLAAGLKAYAHVLASDFGWCMVRVSEYAQPVELAQQIEQQRKALERCFASANHSSMPVSVMLRALEGVVLSAPKAQWGSVIEVLAAQAPRAPMEAVAEPALAETPLGQSFAAPAAAMVDVLPVVPVHVAQTPARGADSQPWVAVHKEADEKNGVQKPPMTSLSSAQKKATNQSVKARHASEKVIDQIALF